MRRCYRVLMVTVFPIQHLRALECRRLFFVTSVYVLNPPAQSPRLRYLLISWRSGAILPGWIYIPFWGRSESCSMTSTHACYWCSALAPLLIISFPHSDWRCHGLVESRIVNGLPANPTVLVWYRTRAIK